MNIPEHRHVNGKLLKEMMREFMEEGGRVILCVLRILAVLRKLRYLMESNMVVEWRHCLKMTQLL
jgi:hypothetical protein